VVGCFVAARELLSGLLVRIRYVGVARVRKRCSGDEVGPASVLCQLTGWLSLFWFEPTVTATTTKNVVLRVLPFACLD
jgi:hypothetical protein